MKTYFRIILGSHLLMALSFTGRAQSETILTIDGNPVSKEEFVSLYMKNNQSLIDDSLKTTPEEYLDLFINYKLKVLEAEHLGMDTLASFRKEFTQYREQLAKQFLNYSEISEADLQQAYQRMCTEVNASHILLRTPPNSTQEQDSAVYDRCVQLRNEIINGANFEETAATISEDPSAQKNQGNLGYFTAFQMVPQFEEAAFSLTPGEISMPVKTKFGYHLIKLIDKRPNPGQIQVAHIMKQVTANASPKDIANATNILDSLKQRIESGEDFAKLAQQFSDDKNSARNGGVLPYFSQSGIVPEFAKASFALMKDGDLSDLVRTPYGLHLIKRIHLKPVPPYDEVKDLLIERLRSNGVFTQQKHDLFITKLKESYNISENKKIINELLQNTNVEEHYDTSNEWLFKIDTTNISVTEFLTAWNKQRQSAKTPLNIRDFYKNYLDEKLIEVENQNLENKNPEFRSLINEYHDGILLFNLMEEKIWTKASRDSAGLRAYYDQNPAKFEWDTRFKGWVIQCNNQGSRDYIDQIFEEDPEISVEELTDLLNLNYKNQASVQKGIFAAGQNELVDYLVWNKSEPKNYKDGLHFVRGDLTPPSAKTLDEAKGQYIAAYQDELEHQWLKDLREKYKVKVNRKVLKTIESIK